MNITIKQKVFKKHPKLRIGFLVLSEINNKQHYRESKHLLKESTHLIQLTFNKDTLKSHLLINPWAVAQEKFGKKAKHYQTSVERLIQRVLRKNNVVSGNTLINLIRHESLRHVVPIGADDFFKVAGDITFDISSGRERKGMLTKSKQGDIYYKDDKGILGTKLDYWKSTRTQVSKYSVKTLVHFQFLPPVSVSEQRRIMNEARELIQTSVGGKVDMAVLTKNKPSVSF